MLVSLLLSYTLHFNVQPLQKQYICLQAVPEENDIQQRMQWNMSAIEIVGVTINSNEDYS